MPKNQFFAKMKNDRGARAIAITVMVLLVLLSAIIITTVIAGTAGRADRRRACRCCGPEAGRRKAHPR